MAPSRQTRSQNDIKQLNAAQVNEGSMQNRLAKSSTSQLKQQNASSMQND
jgi:hypothetical protein